MAPLTHNAVALDQFGDAAQGAAEVIAALAAPHVGDETVSPEPRETNPYPVIAPTPLPVANVTVLPVLTLAAAVVVTGVPPVAVTAVVVTTGVPPVAAIGVVVVTPTLPPFGAVATTAVVPPFAPPVPTTGDVVSGRVPPCATTEPPVADGIKVWAGLELPPVAPPGPNVVLPELGEQFASPNRNRTEPAEDNSDNWKRRDMASPFAWPSTISPSKWASPGMLHLPNKFCGSCVNRNGTIAQNSAPK